MRRAVPRVCNGGNTFPALPHGFSANPKGKSEFIRDSSPRAARALYRVAFSPVLSFGFSLAHMSAKGTKTIIRPDGVAVITIENPPMNALHPSGEPPINEWR